MNVLFMGPPGSGKGTQSKLLCDRFGMVHLSTGDMFREAISKKTEVGMKAKGYMDRGEYVPDSVVIELIQDRLMSIGNHGFILDGFPRTVPQAKALDELLSKLGKVLKGIFYFNVKNETLVQRLSSRRTCRQCNKVVGPEVQSSNCSVAGKACDFYQRDDDKPEVISKRIQVYQEQTTPVIEYYKKGQSFLEVDGAKSADQVFQQILNHLN